MRGLACLLGALLTACSDGTGLDPDTVRIVFQDAGPLELDLFSLTSDGDSLRNLTQSETRDVHPAYTRDRRRIAFIRSDQLWVMDAAGSDQQAVPTGGDAAFPSWSPDQETIAFRSGRGGGWAVWAVTPASGQVRQLTYLDDGEGPTSWTPDGRVVFDDIYGYLRVVDTDGRNMRYLFADTSFVDREPAVSPDGRRIAFTRVYLIGPQELRLQRITVANLDGTDSRMVSSFSFGQDVTPAWSPDGGRIVFAHDEDSDFTLWIVNADGTGQRQLPGTGGSSFRPTW